MAAEKTEARMDLGAVICGLYDNGIDGKVSWFFDGVWSVELGRKGNDHQAHSVVPGPEQAAEWLHENSVRLFTESGFAKPDRANLGTMVAALHYSEISGEISWPRSRRRWRVKLGDPLNGFDAEAVVARPEVFSVAARS
jgi:hypothetical protein